MSTLGTSRKPRDAINPPHTIDRDDLVRLVDRFYENVQRDPVLGPVFNPVVHDWDAHKATLVEFWYSFVLRAARYRGNPMAMHRPHPITAAHFGHWLWLWERTAIEVVGEANAAVLLNYARRIAAA